MSASCNAAGAMRCPAGVRSTQSHAKLAATDASAAARAALCKEAPADDHVRPPEQMTDDHRPEEFLRVRPWLVAPNVGEPLLGQDRADVAMLELDSAPASARKFALQ